MPQAVPAASAARATPSSPSGWAMRMKPAGVVTTGMESSRPSTVVASPRGSCESGTRARSPISRKPSRLSRTVWRRSVPASVHQ